jgi:hypothetical protein
MWQIVPPPPSAAMPVPQIDLSGGFARMKDPTEKIMFILYGLFGAGLGLLIFMFALGGWRFVFAGHATKPWNGVVSLLFCCVLGGGWGLVAYKFKDRQFDSGSSSFYHDPATENLFSKRLMVIATCIAGLYFIWQLARRL